MADINIIVGFETVKQADQAFKILDKTVKSTARSYEQAFNKITGWQKTFSNEQNKVNAALNTQHLAQQKSNKSARESARTFEEAARAVKEKAKEIERLSSKYKPLYATSKLYERSLEEINKAQKLGVLSDKQRGVSIGILNQQFKTGTGIFSTYANGAMKGANRMGVAMQQTGYQVGDFLVQVQSGTNPMVAFGQQATQLVGVLYLLPQATLAAKVGFLGLSMSMGAIIAVVSILVPLASAIGAYFLSAGKDAKEAASDVETLAKAHDTLKSAIDLVQTPLDDLIEKYGEYAAVIKELRVAKLNEQFLDAKDALANTRSELKGLVKELSFVAGFNLQGLAGKLGVKREGFGGAQYTREQIGELDEVRYLLGQIRDIEGPEEQVKVLEKLRASFRVLKVDLKQFPQFSVANLSDYEENVALLEMALEAAEGAANGLGTRMSESFKEGLKSLNAVSNAISENTKEMARSLTIATLETDVINEVAGAEDALGKLRARYARADYLSDQLSKGISGDALTVAMGQYDVLVKQLAVKEAANKAAEAETSQMKSRAENMALGLSYAEKQDKLNDKQEAAVKKITDAVDKNTKSSERQILLNLVEIDALNNIAGAEEHLAVLKAEHAREDHIAKLVGQGILGKNLDKAMKQYDALVRQKQELKDINEKEKARLELLKQQDLFMKNNPLEPFGGPGRFIPNYVDDDKPKGPKVVDPYANLQEQLKLEEALIGKTEARKRVINALGADQSKWGPEAVTKLENEVIAVQKLQAAEEERIRVIEEAKKQQEDLANTITNSMENAFMAMSDGTKSVSDAFRTMAAEIVRELYKVYVMQVAIAAIKTFAGGFFADGGVISGGSEVKAYANGGVVGGPTTFPMAGGKTGLMGEAGPEAIMPLKRGANGKLGVQMEGGGGDTINVVQNFSFAANGDDSVKRIIAQAAPKIAQMTKNSMLNDRRRGGTTKAVFG